MPDALCLLGEFYSSPELKDGKSGSCGPLPPLLFYKALMKPSDSKQMGPALPRLRPLLQGKAEHNPIRDTGESHCRASEARIPPLQREGCTGLQAHRGARVG